MTVHGVCAQLRTTDLEGSIEFYVKKLGFELEFRFSDFYAGIKAGTQVFHLKLVDSPEPSIEFVSAGEHFHLLFVIDEVDSTAAELTERGVELFRAPQNTDWGTRDFYVRDDQGHTLCFSQDM